jgi:hypothetical protein
MKRLKYLVIICMVSTYSCLTKQQTNIDKEKYMVYSAVIDKCINAEHNPLIGGKKERRDFTDLDTSVVVEYNKYVDSIEATLRGKSFYVLVIADSSIEEKMSELQYSVKSNDLFFKEALNGDSSFKDFILEWKPSKAGNKRIEIEKLKSRFKYSVSDKRLFGKNDYLIESIALSEIAFDKTYTKAILYTVSSGGALYFVEKKSGQWFIKASISLWEI